MQAVLTAVSLYVCSSASTATLLDLAGEHRGSVWRRREPDVRRRGVADAERQVAARSGGTDAREQCSDRQERAAADRRTRDGDLHVCRGLGTR